ncbi:MAG: DNA ligase D [Coriobacteriia bacterium]
MPLEEYRAKRHFDRTPEPAGGEGAGPAEVRRFVIHKHAATRLHYDVRLELDGVFKSWAVPKGPSLDTRQKHLAVEVEDHPLEYGDFEGTIPAGEYGGGTVMIWDRGTWEPINDPHEGYAKGDLKVRLSGEKLHGGFVLVRMKRREGEKKDNWLLIKERDEFVRPLDEGDVLELDTSAATGRTMDEIAAQGPVYGVDSPAAASGSPDTAAPPDPATTPGAVPAGVPDVLEPMLATQVKDVPEGDEWLHEIKLDGYRVLARVRNGEVRFFTRSGADWTERFAALAGPVEHLGLTDSWLDGEVVALAEEGRTSFGALQAELGRKAAADITYAVFDAPFLSGYDLRAVALDARKALLAHVLRDAPARVLYVDHVRGAGAEFHRQTCEFALEGAVSKRANSPYRSSRSREWRKHKCRNRQEFVVVGYTEPSSGGAGVGALALATRGPSGDLAFAGRAGSGIGVAEGKRLRKKLDAIVVEAPPVGAVPANEARGVTWTQPQVVVEVEFAEWTASGVLRHPAFLGVREDKAPGEVVREGADEVAGMRLTHPDKVLFSTMGATKHDLARHYEAVAERMLPHLVNRPLVLVRCPHGTDGQCFYQKDVSKGFPARLATVDVEHEEGPVRYAMARDAGDLVSLVQLGVLEIHTWGSLADDIETPDRIVVDLDPAPDVTWPAIVDAALVIRDGLAGLGLVPFAKTTGGKGLHVVVPLERGGDWGLVREFARTFCEMVASADPAAYTTNPLKARRTGRVFIDYIRNSRGATAVAPYSSRALPGATVSMPVSWDAIESGIRSDAFTVANAAAVLAVSPDPWAMYEASRRPISEAARNALGLL